MLRIWRGRRAGWDLVRSSWSGGGGKRFLLGEGAIDLVAHQLGQLPAQQFGLVLVEGMACGLPAVAVDRFGPADIVVPGETGWLVDISSAQSLRPKNSFRILFPKLLSHAFTKPETLRAICPAEKLNFSADSITR